MFHEQNNTFSPVSTFFSFPSQPPMYFVFRLYSYRFPSCSKEKEEFLLSQAFFNFSWPDDIIVRFFDFICSQMFERIFERLRYYFCCYNYSFDCRFFLAMMEHLKNFHDGNSFVSVGNCCVGHNLTGTDNIYNAICSFLLFNLLEERKWNRRCVCWNLVPFIL